MINFSEYKNTTTDAFATIQEDGVYSGRLFAMKLSKQDKKFVEDGKEPKDLISFMFDIINEEGNHVHVSTKPTGISFTDRSNLPKLFEKVTKLESGDDMNKFFYDEKALGRVFKVMVEVKNVDDKYFATVTKVTGKSAAEIEPSSMTAWDLNVYGTPCIQYDLAEGYKEPPTDEETDDDEDEFIKRTVNK